MEKNFGFKLGIISGIALLLFIPLSLVQMKIAERHSYKQEARSQVANSWTGTQTVMTPLLVQPYQVEVSFSKNGYVDNATTREVQTRYQLIAPKQIKQNTQLSTQTRSVGIYQVPVYTADINIEGQFDREVIAKTRQRLAGAVNHRGFQAPFLSLYIADPRGIDRLPKALWQGENLNFSPGSKIPLLDKGVHAELPPLDKQASGTNLEFAFSISLRGMETLKLVPAAMDAQFLINSSWPHPRFEGMFLPKSHNIHHKGFEANWSINEFSSGISNKLQKCQESNCTELSSLNFGVSLIDPVDVYMQSERSAKYGILFIGLSFIAFFMFETMKRLRIHPIQYSLVGLAIAIFYLVLLSLSEHVAFGQAYFTAATACITLITFYVWHILQGPGATLFFFLMLAVLYALLYVIIQAEDYALMMGSLLVFAVLSVIMVLTRKVDWYELGDQLARKPIKK